MEAVLDGLSFRYRLEEQLGSAAFGIAHNGPVLVMVHPSVSDQNSASRRVSRQSIVTPRRAEMLTIA
jgi:hypothetical protein